MVSRDVMVRLGTKSIPGGTAAAKRLRHELQGVGRAAGGIRNVRREMGGIRKSSGLVAIALRSITGGGIFPKMRSGFSMVRRMIVGIVKVAVAAAAAIALLTKTAMPFDKGMTKLSTIVEIPRKEFKALGVDLRKMAVEYGVSSAKLAEAAYQAASAGIKEPPEMRTFLGEAIKASIGGIADMPETVAVLTSALTAYQLAVDQTAHVSDLLFTTVKEGKTEFGMLAQNLGPLIKIAPAAGVGLKELLASVATLTQKGGMKSTPIVITELKSAIMSFLKPGKEMNEWAKKMGYSHASLILKNKGLAETLRMLRDEYGGNAAALGELFPNVNAISSVLELSGASAQEFTRVLGEMENATGATGRAYEKFANSDSKEVEDAINTIREIFIDLGLRVLPYVADALREIRVERVFDALQESSRDSVKALDGVVDVLMEVWKYVKLISGGSTLEFIAEQFGAFDYFKPGGAYDQAGEQAGLAEFRGGEKDRLERFSKLLRQQLDQAQERMKQAREKEMTELVRMLEENEKDLMNKMKMVAEKYKELTGEAMKESTDELVKGVQEATRGPERDIAASLATAL